MSKFIDELGLTYLLQKIKALVDLKANVNDLSNVASSGSYSDLVNVPTKLSEFTNDIGFVSSRGNSSSFPLIFFDTLGNDLPTSKANGELKVKMTYKSSTETFSCYATIKVQGNSSQNYSKKNWTLKLYSDSELTTKMKHNFNGWGNQSKYVLKADWIDISHARNIVSARIWADIVKSRSDLDTLPERLLSSPNYGAIDGFICKVYFNGYYYGRYDLNIPKDKWMTNMDDKIDGDVILCGEDYNSSCFRSLWGGVNENGWSDELRDRTTNTVKTQLNNFIDFVMHSTDDDFKANFENYADLQSFIDYYIYHYFICGLDAFGKNQILLSYGGGKYYASSYDMDSTFGLYWNGSKFVSITYRCQEDYEVGTHNTTNLLYDRIVKLYEKEISLRYVELRQGPLSLDNVILRFEEFIGNMPAELIAEDYAATTGKGAFQGIPSRTTNNIQQIRNYIAERSSYADIMLNTYILLQSLTIIGDTVIQSDCYQFTVECTPTNANEQRVIWGIESGSEYATIDSSTGLLTIDSSANNSSITIKATSLDDSSIYATKDIIITYENVPPITAIEINSDSEIIAREYQLSITCTPIKPVQPEVIWSIESGSEYATIDSSTGLLTIDSSANNSSITIKAVLAENNEIYATKDIIITYENVPPITAIEINSDSEIIAREYQLSITCTPIKPVQPEVIWSIESGSEYATIDSSTGLLTIDSSANNSSITIKAVLAENNEIYATKDIIVTYKVYIYELYDYDFNSNPVINTGIKLWKYDNFEIEFSIVYSGNNPGNATVLSCMNESSGWPWPGLLFRINNDRTAESHLNTSKSEKLLNKIVNYANKVDTYTYKLIKTNEWYQFVDNESNITKVYFNNDVITYTGNLIIGDSYNYLTNEYLNRLFKGRIVSLTIKDTVTAIKEGVPSLPDGYTNVDYIASTNTGGQYIDLGLKMYETSPVSFNIEMAFKCIGYGKDNVAYSTLLSAMKEISPYPGMYIRMMTNKRNNVMDSFNIHSIPPNTRSTISITKNNLTTKTHDVNTTLFCAYDESGNPFRFTEAQIYKCQIKLNSDDFVRDLWPCLNPDNVPGLYDITNNVFYSSMSDTPFIYG